MLGRSVSPFIKDESIQAVLSSANIVEVVSGYTSLRKRGATHTRVSAPFIKRRRPRSPSAPTRASTTVSAAARAATWSAFLERTENLTFSEAIEQLGERFGVPVQYEEGGGAGRGAQGAGRTAAAVDGEGHHVLSAVSLGIGQGRRSEGVPGEAGAGRGDLSRPIASVCSPPGWRGLHARAVQGGVHRSRARGRGPAGTPDRQDL